MSKDVNNIGNRSSVQKALKDVDVEYKKQKIAFVLQVSKINTGRIQTPEEMQERFEKLFELCAHTGNIPNYEALAVSCGIPISTFYDMKTGEFERIQEILGNHKASKDCNRTNGEQYGF